MKKEFSNEDITDLAFITELDFNIKTANEKIQS